MMSEINIGREMNIIINTCWLRSCSLQVVEQPRLIPRVLLGTRLVVELLL